MPPFHPSALPAERLLAECDIVRTRRSGPGGQHRNKVETAIVISHRPTGICAEASERRSQSQNQTEAIFRLRVKLALSVRGNLAEVSQPSELWQSRCRGGQLKISREHADFPPLLAEALDAVAAYEMDVKQAAIALGCTPSQLLKFLQLEPLAIQHVNQDRERRGLRKLFASR